MAQKTKRNTGHLIASIYVVLLTTVFLLSVPPDGYVSIVQYKYALFMTISGGFVLAIVIHSVVHAVRSRAKPRLMDSAAQVALVLYALFTILSALISPYNTLVGAFRYEGVLTICAYVLPCLPVSKFLVPQRWMLAVFAASLAVFSVICIAQLCGGNPFHLYPGSYNYYDAGVYYQGEYLGTIGNTTLCTAYLCLSVGVFAGAYLCLDRKTRQLSAAALFLAVFVLLKMQTDAGYLGLAGGFLLLVPAALTDVHRLSRILSLSAVEALAVAGSVLLRFGDGSVSLGNGGVFLALVCLSALLFGASVLCGRPKQSEKTRWWRIGAVVFCAAAIVGALLFLRFYRGAPGSFLYEASEVLHGRVRDEFGSGRIYIWRNVMENSRFLFGTGPDTIGQMPIDYFARFNETLGIVMTSKVDAAHNEYLNIFACQGIFALAAYLSALVLSAVNWYKNPDNAAVLIAGAGAAFYCVQAFFGISMMITAPFFWLALAVLMRAAPRCPPLQSSARAR